MVHVFQQTVAKEYMKKYGIQIMSWGPFAEGKNDYFNNPVLKKIGDKYGKSVAQVAFRFLLQSDVVLIILLWFDMSKKTVGKTGYYFLYRTSFKKSGRISDEIGT